MSGGNCPDPWFSFRGTSTTIGPRTDDRRRTDGRTDGRWQPTVHPAGPGFYRR